MDYSAFNANLREYLRNEGSWKNYHESISNTQPS